MSQLDPMIVDAFPGLAVRKDLTKLVKGNAVVPTYVLEYLLGQYCATDDPDTIETGIETVKNILEKHYVQREEAELIKSEIHRKGKHKVIDKITVSFNESSGVHEASFTNLGIKKVELHSETAKKHPKLLVGGVWCIVDVGYETSEDTKKAPWVIESLKPIQVSNVDFDQYVEARSKFTLEQWMDMMLQTMGLNPEQFGKRGKLFQLLRLLPYCERNYNFIELGPKGTGKSHIFSEFSPHGILISGGEVSVAKLFVNNSSAKIGLVGYWDVVAFDEFAGKAKKVDKNLVDIMKNYMANKTFSRGRESIGAEASMAFMGNTKHSVPHMLKNSDLFDELADKYHDSAFLDRFHYYIPGWEVEVLRNEMFTSGYGLIVDYLAEILKHLRSKDYSQSYREFFELNSNVSTRDQAAIVKTISGLVKVLYPGNDCPKEEMKLIMDMALEGRKRVKNQLLRIDPDSFSEVSFSYTDKSTGEVFDVLTMEEIQYPQFCNIELKGSENEKAQDTQAHDKVEPLATAGVAPVAQELTLLENQKGFSLISFLGPYLTGASELKIHDPNLKTLLNLRHLNEIHQHLSKQVTGDDINVELTYNASPELDAWLEQLSNSLSGTSINFTSKPLDFPVEGPATLETNSGWKVSFSHGLDVYKSYDVSNPFGLEQGNSLQRQCLETVISVKK